MPCPERLGQGLPGFVCTVVKNALRFLFTTGVKALMFYAASEKQCFSAPGQQGH